jgi:hypothetical protein
MTRYTYEHQYAARISGGHYDGEGVTIPDQVYRDQRAYDGETITVILDGVYCEAILRGDLYGLDTPGTGDPVVVLA